jgi:Carboxypeptidase regulatory-like domain/TonB dependent receptor
MQSLSLVDKETRSSRPSMVILKLALFLVLAAIPGFAQTDTGSIVGTVRDASGVVIAGAKVDITNTATAVTRTLETNSDGEYQVLQLIPGIYTIKASQSGFATGVRDNVTINVQTRAQVDFQLTVGVVTTQVQVEASTQLLETQTAGVSGIVNAQALNDLPLNGRDYDQLALTQPGVFRNNAVSNPAEGLFSANGNLQLQNYFQLDGIDNNSKSENLQEQSTQSVIPPPDALQEFVLQTRTYSAEFGTSAGAVVNVSTKSGTNSFHGDAWDYIQNGALNANTFFNNYNSQPRGTYNQNQFGGTIGGPIRRNHTFFFVSFEQLLSNIASTVTSIVPTAAMHNGDFSSNTNGPYMSAANRLMTPLVPSQAGCITPPNSAQPNVIKPSCFDSVGKAVMDLYPLPSPALGNVNIFTGAANYIYTATLPNNTKTLDVRVDHTLNPANQIFARYAFLYSDYQNPAPWTSNPVAGNGSGFPTTYILHDQSVALGWTYTIKTNLTNTAHFGFLRTYSHSDPIGLTPGQSAASQIGLNGVPNNPFVTGIPPFQETGINSIGSAYYRPQYQVAQTYQILDAVYWLKGRHSFQFGYEYHQDALNFFDIQAPQGIIYNSGIYTNTSLGGFGAGDLLLGDVSRLILGTTNEVNNYIRGNSFYAQDTWRASSNLTVNYGLRYELYPPFWLNRDGRTANFSCGPQYYPACIANGPAPNGGTIVTANGNGWAGATQMNTDLNNLVPRIGVSYHIFKPIVIRAGYGVFHQFINRIGSESLIQLNPPFLGSWTISQTVGSTIPVFQLNSPNGMNSSAYLSSASLNLLLTPGPAVTCVTGTLINGVCVNGVAGGLPTQHIRAQGQNNRTSYIQQVSFGIQQQITESTIFSLNYVGNWGRKMNRVQDANQGFVKSCPTCSVVTPNAVIYFPLTSFNSGNSIDANNTSNGAGQHAFVELALNDGNTDFNALEANIQRQFKHGLAYSVSYTWSHNMANFVDNLTGGDTPQNAHDYAHEMSNSFQDVRHRFAATGTYQLPIGKDGLVLNNGGVVSSLLGNWQLNAIVTLATGQPFNVTASDASDTGINHAVYANCIGDPFAGASKNPIQYAGTKPTTTGFFINSAAFSAPTLGTFGSCRPRAWHGPGLETTDLSLFKSFPIAREYRVETRFEAFNAFNHPSFGNPAANISTSGANFGKVTTTTVGPRTFQIAAKFYF